MSAPRGVPRVERLLQAGVLLAGVFAWSVMAAAQALSPGARIDAGAGRVVSASQLLRTEEADGQAVEVDEVASPNESEVNRVPPPKEALLEPPPMDGAPRTEAFAYTAHLARTWLSHIQSGEPPDPMIAAGLQHVVSVVNTRILINSKDSTQVYTANLNTFFGVPAGEPGIFDTKVIYDKDDDRFWIMTVARTCTAPIKSRMYLAVSASSDPTTGWIHYGPYDIMLSSNWGDYPGLGVGRRTVVVAWNYLPCAGAPTDRLNAVWIFNKAPMLTGGNTFYDSFVDVTGWNNTSPGILMPSTTWGTPAGAESFIASVQFDAATGNLKPTLHGVQVPADYPTGFPSLNRQTGTTSNPGPIQLAPQLGGPATITTWNLGSPPMSCVYRNGHVWVATHYAYAGGAASQAWTYDIDVSAWPSMSVQTAGFTDGTSFYYYPAATANAYGDVAMVFGRSSPTEYAGSRWTLRFAGEPSFQSSLALQTGRDYYGENGDTAANSYRWGDYAGAAVDPVDEGFWLFHEHAEFRSAFSPRRRWATRIGYVPRAVFVDRAYAGSTQDGRRSSPYRTVNLGHFSALGGNDLVIRTGSYPEAMTLSKPVTIIPDGGPVTIGQ